MARSLTPEPGSDTAASRVVSIIDRVRDRLISEGVLAETSEDDHVS